MQRQDDGLSAASSPPRPSTLNCTWRTFEQPLNHFGAPLAMFQQRVCLYTGFWRQDASAGGLFKAAGKGDKGPIFFYTGNESPLDVYINNTGLMWEAGRRQGALLVFAEHRFEPASHPCLQGTENCYGYCTTAQALADYAALVKALKQDLDAESSPVVAFGGSYGGMLAGWFRIRYPDIVAGSIAASAPSFGFATTMTTERLDWSAQAISRGVSAAGGASDRCLANLRATWPLIDQVGRTRLGLDLLGEAAKSCRPLQHPKELRDWAQAPWFLLAEGNYPFASTYITYAVGPGYVELPPWPMRVACAKGLDSDFGVQVHSSGEAEDVRYNITVGDLRVSVDWAEATGNGDTLSEEQLKQSRVLDLVEALREAVAVWYNVTRDHPCFDMAPAPNSEAAAPRSPEGAAAPSSSSAAPSASAAASDSAASCPKCPLGCEGCPACPVANCEAGLCNYTKQVSNTFSWEGIVCNDDIWLYNTNVQGLGHDLFWPPTAKRGATLADLVGPRELVPGCGRDSLEIGLAGAPKLKDPWSGWATGYYGGANISHVRNIAWSQGLLDPWCGGGVYPPDGGIFGPLRQNISSDGSQAALLIDLGGHHLDLFFEHPDDPPSVREVRKIEEAMIVEWCEEWYANAAGDQSAASDANAAGAKSAASDANAAGAGARSDAGEAAFVI